MIVIDDFRQAEIRERVNAFENLPRWVQVVHVATTVVLVGTFYCLMIYPSKFFQSFGLTDCWRYVSGGSIHEPLPNVTKQLWRLTAHVPPLVVQRHGHRAMERLRRLRHFSVGCRAPLRVWCGRHRHVRMLRLEQLMPSCTP